MVRSGDFKSDYSSDEERGADSDDSVIDGNRAKVGVTAQHKDNLGYVDAMVNRHNPTDLRLLRASINEHAGKSTKRNGRATDAGRGTPGANDYGDEADTENQEFTKKIAFEDVDTNKSLNIEKNVDITIATDSN